MTSRTSARWGALLGFLSGIVVVAIAVLAQGAARLPNPFFHAFEWLTRRLPGALVTFGIDLIVGTITRLGIGPTAVAAKLAEELMAAAQGVVLGTLLGLALARFGRRRPGALPAVGAVVGAALAAGAIAIEASMGFRDRGPAASIAWLAFLFVGWSAWLGWAVRLSAGPAVASVAVPRAVPVAGPGEPGPERLGRRRALQLLTGGLVVLSAGLGALVVWLRRPRGAARTVTSVDALVAAQAPRTSGPAASPPPEALEERSPPVPGTRPELTPTESFYRIDINLEPPRLSEASWRLELGGLVATPLRLAVANLRRRPSVTQAITLECISNRLGGDLISTALFTGVPLRDLLAEARPGARARSLFVQAADGFYETVSLEDAGDPRTLLVYAMNGEPLPVAHGFPLRIYIPNRFGMKQPKWIERITVVDDVRPGYWVERGWSREAIPPTTSVIDAVHGPAIGGIAYAGARGIQKVEVQIDDGPWREAELRAPPLSPLTWVQWRLSWSPTPGEHTVRVRATDGRGELQTATARAEHPSGATGIHSITVRV